MAKRGRPAIPLVVDRIDGAIWVVDGPKSMVGREVHFRENGEKEALHDAAKTFIDAEDGEEVDFIERADLTDDYEDDLEYDEEYDEEYEVA